MKYKLRKKNKKQKTKNKTKQNKQKHKKTLIIINTTELFRSAHVNYTCISHYLEKNMYPDYWEILPSPTK